VWSPGRETIRDTSRNQEHRKGRGRGCEAEARGTSFLRIIVEHCTHSTLGALFDMIVSKQAQHGRKGVSESWYSLAQDPILLVTSDMVLHCVLPHVTGDQYHFTPECHFNRL